MSSLTIMRVGGFGMTLPQTARAGEDSRPRSMECDSRGLPRLRILLEDAAVEAPDWDRIHSGVQKLLEELWLKIAAAFPGSLSKPGRAKTPNVPLFSYRVFYRESFDEDDPILVGVVIQDRGGAYLVEGEVVGEETGHLHFDESFDVPKGSPDLADRVDGLAGRLAQTESIVLEAMSVEGERAHQ